MSFTIQELDLRPPIPQVEKVVPNRPVGQLRNRGQHPLEMVAPYAIYNLADEVLGKPCLGAIFRRIALVHQQVEQSIHFCISEPQLAFIGLPDPEISGRRFLNYLLWESYRPPHLAYLSLVQVAQGVERAGRVAV